MSMVLVCYECFIFPNLQGNITTEVTCHHNPQGSCKKHTCKTHHQPVDYKSGTVILIEGQLSDCIN